MIPINYHHLYYFWTVAKCGSIAAAKERLYLSQPTLSSQLQELEGFCKFKLLERNRKGVVLTPEGQTVFSYCERIFSEGDELVALLNKGFAGPSILRMGIDLTVSRDVVVRILEFARQVDKKIRIAVFNRELEVLSAQLRRHTLDFGVSDVDFAAQLGRDFRSRLVCSLPVYFVASPSVKKAVKRFPSHLSKIPILLRPPENPVRKQVDQYLSRHRISTSVEADVEDVDLIRRLAVGGRGAAAMNALAIGPDLKSGRLLKLHKGPLQIKENIWFVCGKYPKPNSALQKMIDALMEKFKVRP